MKKILTTLLLLSSYQTIIAKNIHPYNTNDGVSFDLSLSAGTQTMLANELLYDSSINHLNSQLIWDTKALAMIGIGGSLHFRDLYTLNLKYWFSANDSNSKMTDFDWLKIGPDWSHRSIHQKTNVSSAFTFDISIAAKSFQFSTTSLSLLSGYRQDSVTRKAYGGEFIYSTEDGFRDDIRTYPDTLLGSSYKQTWKSSYFGFKTHTQITDRFSLNSQIIYAPFSKVNTFDRHYLRSLIFSSTLDASMYAINAGLDYKITNHLTTKLNYMYQKFDADNGVVKWVEKGQVSYGKDASGADLKTSVVSISLDYKF